MRKRRKKKNKTSAWHFRVGVDGCAPEAGAVEAGVSTTSCLRPSRDYVGSVRDRVPKVGTTTALFRAQLFLLSMEVMMMMMMMMMVVMVMIGEWHGLPLA